MREFECINFVKKRFKISLYLIGWLLKPPMKLRLKNNDQDSSIKIIFLTN